MTHHHIIKALWLVAGLACLALGIIGAVLPLLPTVPFLLLAAFFFARSSDKLHNWLISHRLLGPPILAWRESGVIGRRGKVFATASMLATFLISLWLAVSETILLVQLVVLSGVAYFIWSRPEG